MAETITIDLHRADSLPPQLHGAVAKDGSRYMIILNGSDTPARQLAAFLHEMTHIYNGDLLTGQDAGDIENRAHKQLLEALEILKQEA